MKKDFPTYLEEMASEYDYIIISAGKIGMQVKLDTAELVKLTDAKLADLV